MRELGSRAFWGCRELKRVSFQQGSALEKIETTCFKGSAIEEITIPRSVVEIQAEAFGECECLQRITFEEGTRL